MEDQMNKNQTNTGNACALSMAILNVLLLFIVGGIIWTAHYVSEHADVLRVLAYGNF